MRRRFLFLAPVLLLAAAGVWRSSEPQSASAEQDTAPPTVHDDRLQLDLFASDPDITTPIGLAIDRRDRLFVLESHTHLPPSDYPGPDGDRIKMFTDEDRDGAPDDVSVFADNIENGMNLAFSPDGTLHVVTSRSVWALHDRDGDGVSEGRTRLLHMPRPDYVYDHAGLLGITFSPDGWLYVSRGNTGGGAWTLAARDGSSLSGYGDGGNVVRLRPDGTDLEEVATGFWNPFDLAFDGEGRLLMADNDPDSRGPNRLVHVIRGGHYGYESLYGGSGIHPYLAWHGELPGTLPFAAALGEAPSGILTARRTALPNDYRSDVLATIWEESTVSRVHLEEHGASVTGHAEPLIEGDEHFRPVAVAADSRGTVYITDWVLRQYPSHDRGRIWRLTTHSDVDTTPPAVAPVQHDGVDSLQALYDAGPGDFERLKTALRSEDPFVRTAAVTALSRPTFRERVVALTRSRSAALRLGALLALRRSSDAHLPEVAHRLLADPDPQVRRLALIWTGSALMTALRPHLETALTAGPASPKLFETYLATVRHLQPDFVAAYRSREAQFADEIERALPAGFVSSFIRDTSMSSSLRATAVPYLQDPAEHVDLLTSLLGESALALRLEAVRTLAQVPRADVGRRLLDLAADAAQPATLRAEALLALVDQPVDAAAEVLSLLNDPAAPVRVEATRYLRTASLRGDQRDALRARYEKLHNKQKHRAVTEQLASVLFALGDRAKAATAARPDSDAAWQEAVAQGGDPAAGRRVFFSSLAQCAQCHRINNRGGDFGPDRTGVGQSKSRRQLARAVLKPSVAIAPQWQGWQLKTKDGHVHQGRQIDVGEDDVEIYTMDGTFATFENVESYEAMDTSLMPDELESQLTVRDFRNLVAYLDAEKVD